MKLPDITKKVLLLVFIFGMFYRLGLYSAKMHFAPPADRTLLLSFPDEQNYHSVASAISESRESFIEWASLLKFSFGWHYFIAAVYYLFGPHPVFIKIINVVIGSLTPVISCKLASEFFNKRAAFWTLLLTAVSPSLAWYSIFILKDSTLAFLLILFVYASLKLSARRTFLNMSWAVILFVILVFIKTQMAIICLPVVVATIFKMLKSKLMVILSISAALIVVFYISDKILLPKILNSAEIPKVTFLNKVDVDNLESLSIFSLPSAITVDDFLASCMEYAKKLVDFFSPIPFDVDSSILRYAVLPFNMVVFSFFVIGTLFFYLRLKNTALIRCFHLVCVAWLTFSLFQPHWRYRLCIAPLVIVIASVYIAAAEKSYFRIIAAKDLQCSMIPEETAE